MFLFSTAQSTTEAAQLGNANKRKKQYTMNNTNTATANQDFIYTIGVPKCVSHTLPLQDDDGKPERKTTSVSLLRDAKFFVAFKTVNNEFYHNTVDCDTLSGATNLRDFLNNQYSNGYPGPFLKNLSLNTTVYGRYVICVDLTCAVKETFEVDTAETANICSKDLPKYISAKYNRKDIGHILDEAVAVSTPKGCI